MPQVYMTDLLPLDESAYMWPIADGCPFCQHETGVLRWKPPHVGLYCQRCARWQEWLPRPQVHEVFVDLDVTTLPPA